MPKKKTKDLLILVQRVLAEDNKFYCSLEDASIAVINVRNERIGLEKTNAPETAIKKAKQKEARLVNALLQRIRGSVDTRFEALEVVLGGLEAYRTFEPLGIPFLITLWSSRKPACEHSFFITLFRVVEFRPASQISRRAVARAACRNFTTRYCLFLKILLVY